MCVQLYYCLPRQQLSQETGQRTVIFIDTCDMSMINKQYDECTCTVAKVFQLNNDGLIKLQKSNAGN